MQVEPSAASDTDGEIHFHMDPHDPYAGSASTVATAKHTTTVRARPIDDVVVERGLRGPFLLKLDTQGHEAQVLGGASTVLEDAALVQIETYGVPEPGRVAFDEVCSIMHGYGFRAAGMADFMMRPSDGLLWQMDTMFLRHDNPRWNHTNWV